MEVTDILHKVLGTRVGLVHQGRKRRFFSIVEALLQGRQCTLTALGRALSVVTGRTNEKHSIKRVDRCLERCVLLVDGTDYTGDYSALVASVPCGGRSVDILAMVVPKKKIASRSTETAFLAKLDVLLQGRSNVVLVTDAGFSRPWFRAVQRRGWDFIGRLSRTAHVQSHRIDTAPWVPSSSFHKKARYHRAIDVGTFSVAKTNPYTARVVLYKKKPKKRHGATKPNRKGVHPSMGAYRSYQSRNTRPWVLVTSLSTPATDVARLYATRMQCEENFRDLKSHRFGFSMEDVQVSTTKRAEVLFAIASLAHWLALIVGSFAEATSLHTSFQANSITKRRVLSSFFLGLRVLAHTTNISRYLRFPPPSLSPIILIA